jgi:hypothetical protein
MVGIFSVCDALWQLSVVFLFPIFLVWILVGGLSLVVQYFGFLFFNLVCGYVLDYPCIFSYVGVLAVEHPIDLWYLWSRCCSDD